MLATPVCTTTAVEPEPTPFDRLNLGAGGLRPVFIRYPHYWLTLLRVRRTHNRGATVVLRGTGPVGQAAARDFRRVLRQLVDEPLVDAEQGTTGREVERP